jgi:hypothetical protein
MSSTRYSIILHDDLLIRLEELIATTDEDAASYNDNEKIIVSALDNNEGTHDFSNLIKAVISNTDPEFYALMIKRECLQEKEQPCC